MSYSDNEKTEAIIRLAMNKYDFNKTAQELNIPAMTLRRWNKNVAKKQVNVPYLLERAIAHLLMTIPQHIDGKDWPIALGILMDKWLLVQGKATSRQENVSKRIGDMSGNMLDDVLEEASRIIDEVSSGETSPRPGPSED